MTPERAAPPPAGATATATQFSGRPNENHLTAAGLEWRATTATLAELLVALTDEVGDASDYFCPRCQPTYREQMLHAPFARLVAEWLAECRSCHATFTVWELRRRVLEDADAVARLVIQ